MYIWNKINSWVIVDHPLQLLCCELSWGEPVCVWGGGGGASQDCFNLSRMCAMNITCGAM